jgi:type IV pilus assembly protein PilW
MFLIRCATLIMILDRRTARAETRQSGYTIVELMVAVTISLIILASLVSVFANNSRTRGEIERANQQTENGRYALQLIVDDLHNAGYLAEFNPGPLATPAAKPDPCDPSPTALKNALPLAVQGYDNGTNAPTCLADLKAGTDILVVRHASTCAVGTTGCDANVAGDAYFQTSGCNSQAELASGNIATYYVLDTNSASFTLHKKDCATLANQYKYRTHIYFVANNDQAGDGIPTLMRAELGATFNIVPLVEGVEQLQIEYGLDTVPTTGAPAVYTADPDSYNGCAATPSVCVGYWRSTVAAKINVLTRNTAQTRGYVDGKVYTLGLKANGAANTFGPYNDAYKRHTNESVVKLNNPAGRNTP